MLTSSICAGRPANTDIASPTTTPSVCGDTAPAEGCPNACAQYQIADIGLTGIPVMDPGTPLSYWIGGNADEPCTRAGAPVPSMTRTLVIATTGVSTTMNCRTPAEKRDWACACAAMRRAATATNLFMEEAWLQ